jgi:predicted nucleotidyltransferase
MIKKSVKAKIKEFFLKNPTIKLRVRQIEREVKVPLPGVIRYVKELEEEGILKSLEIANIKVYMANRVSEKYLLEKKLFNVKELYEVGLIENMVKEFSNPTIVVFGSYSRGEDVEKSDIDIYIESVSKKRIKFEKFEKKLERKIQIFVYRDISKIKNKNLANNIINGILLNGFVEVFK